MSFPSVSIISIFEPGQELALLATAESLMAKFGREIQWEHCLLAHPDILPSLSLLLQNQFRLPYPLKKFATHQVNPYLARNEGICVSQGEIIVFLQPGDRILRKEVFQRVLSRLQKSEAAIAWAGWEEVREGKKIIRKAPDSIQFSPNSWQSGNLSSIWFRREFFRKFGLFSPLYTCLGEVEILLRTYGKAFRFHSVLGEVVMNSQRPSLPSQWQNEWHRLFFQYKDQFGWKALAQFRLAKWQRDWMRGLQQSRTATFTRLWYR